MTKPRRALYAVPCAKLLVIVSLFALLALALWFAGVAWERFAGDAIPLYGWSAIAGGVLFSLLVGGGLMALVFYSSRHGYDDGQRRRPRPDAAVLRNAVPRRIPVSPPAGKRAIDAAAARPRIRKRAMNKTLVQEQFGKTAASYLTSTPHAKGASLERLVALTAPQKNWRVLDVATGGGHVAYTFAPHVARIWATDITQEMLDMVKAEAQKRGLANVRTAYAKAEALPFEDASFDLVTCRIAPHHFDSIPEFLAEVHRVLKPGGAGRDGRQRGAGGQRRRLRQRLRALPRSQPPARLDHGGMARRARRRRASPSRTKSRSTRRWNSRAGPRATTPTCRTSCARCWRRRRPR